MARNSQACLIWYSPQTDTKFVTKKQLEVITQQGNMLQSDLCIAHLIDAWRHERHTYKLLMELQCQSACRHKQSQHQHRGLKNTQVFQGGICGHVTIVLAAPNQFRPEKKKAFQSLSWAQRACGHAQTAKRWQANRPSATCQENRFAPAPACSWTPPLCPQGAIRTSVSILWQRQAENLPKTSRLEGAAKRKSQTAQCLCTDVVQSSKLTLSSTRVYLLARVSVCAALVWQIMTRKLSRHFSQSWLNRAEAVFFWNGRTWGEKVSSIHRKNKVYYKYKVWGPVGSAFFWVFWDSWYTNANHNVYIIVCIYKCICLQEVIYIYTQMPGKVGIP